MNKMSMTLDFFFEEPMQQEPKKEDKRAEKFLEEQAEKIIQEEKDTNFLDGKNGIGLDELSRDQKIAYLEKKGFYDQRNEDNFLVFPECDKCNENKRNIIIKNNNPIVYAVMEVFPNCSKCNTDYAMIIIEKTEKDLEEL